MTKMEVYAMNYYHYSNSQPPTGKNSPKVIVSTSSLPKKKVKKTSECGCGKKKIITND
jgi:hypothetical protein